MKAAWLAYAGTEHCGRGEHCSGSKEGFLLRPVGFTGETHPPYIFKKTVIPACVRMLWKRREHTGAPGGGCPSDKAQGLQSCVLEHKAAEGLSRGCRRAAG